MAGYDANKSGDSLLNWKPEAAFGEATYDGLLDAPASEVFCA